LPRRTRWRVLSCSARTSATAPRPVIIAPIAPGRFGGSARGRQAGAFWVLLSRTRSRGADALAIVKSETVIAGTVGASHESGRPNRNGSGAHRWPPRSSRSSCAWPARTRPGAVEGSSASLCKRARRSAVFGAGRTAMPKRPSRRPSIYNPKGAGHAELRRKEGRQRATRRFSGRCDLIQTENSQVALSACRRHDRSRANRLGRREQWRSCPAHPFVRHGL
jgi:hypothetical protein